MIQTNALYCNNRPDKGYELGRPITSMDNPLQNIGELRLVLLDKWAEIPVERL